MKSFVTSLTALFLAVAVIGCSESAPGPAAGSADDPTAAMDAAQMAGEGAATDGEAAEGEGDAAPAEGEGDAAPAEGEGDAAPAEGDKAE